MWVKGKFGDWGATACGIKDTRVEKKKKKKVVWVLYRKVAFVCTKSHPIYVWVCVQLSRDRQTDSWIRDRTAGPCSTLWDLLIRSRCLNLLKNNIKISELQEFFHFFLIICIICLQLKKQTMLIRYVHFLLNSDICKILITAHSLRMFWSNVRQSKLVTFMLKWNLTLRMQLNLSTKLTMLIHDSKY